MQKELQFTLSIIGILIIGGVLLHGMWTIRKSGKKQKKSRLESRNWEPEFEQDDSMSGEAPIYDDIGVGKARVVINPVNDTEELEPDDLKGVSVSRHDEVIERASSINAPLNDEVAFDNSVDTAEVRKEFDNHFEATKQDPVYDEIDEVITRNLDEHETLDSGVSQVNDLNFDTVEASTVLDDDKNENQDPTVSIDAEEVKNQSETPVYSNVVTQPKPEFTRPIQTNTNIDNSFGHPPEFLLKKTDDDNQDAPQSLRIKENQSPAFNTPEAPSIQDQAFESEAPLLPKREPEVSHETNKPTPASPDFSLNIQDGPKVKLGEEVDDTQVGVEKELSFAEQAKRFVRRNKKTVGEKIRKEPVYKDKAAEDQMRIDFDEAESIKAQDTAAAAANNIDTKPSEPAPAKAETVETDVLVLNVRASDENPIQGASLLPMLLTLGFKFGEHDIFHRHVNTNGKGPILFSLTNMFKPGVFDIDNIENFSTYGLSLFMMLPIEGDAQQVFNMMHNAARKLSEEFDGRILDGNKVGVSKQSMQQYVERIREFERKRINK